MKDFLLISNYNAVTYKEFFPLLKEGTVHEGYTKPKEYISPSGTKRRRGIHVGLRRSQYQTRRNLY